MDLPLGIQPLVLDKYDWTNAHTNFIQKLKKDACFELTVSGEEFERKYPTFKEQYNKTTENIQWLIKHAIDKKIRLRAMGSGWSLSKVAVSEDGIINTKKLVLKAELAKTQVAQSYIDKGGDPGNLFFTQCGNTVIAINDFLERKKKPAKSLRASGGSNGQTIVGALSTGTHGGAFKFGSLSEFVVGLHIVVGPNRHVWLERASYQVTSNDFRSWIKAEVILDDDLFYSALVSFGSFGFIHSVMIEVEPKFLLEQHLERVPFTKGIEKAIKFGDFTGFAPDFKLKHPIDTLYHFELAINPHNFKKYSTKEDGVYVRVMYKLPYRDDYTRIEQKTTGNTYGDDVLGLVQSVLDNVEKISGKLNLAIVPKAVNTLFKTAYDRPPSAIGTVGETFRNTIFRGKLFSGAFSFDRAVILDVVDIALNINKTIPFAGIIALRFVKGTKATLGFARFENTCVLEMDGVDADVNHRFTKTLAEQCESKGIQYALHWGKINTILTKERLRRNFGEKNANKWLNHRKQLLTDEVRAVFNNGFLESCGLDKSEDVLA